MSMNESKLAYQHKRRTMSIFCLSYALSSIPLIGTLDTIVILISLFCIALRFAELINIVRTHSKWLTKFLAIVIFATIAFYLAKNGLRTHLVNAFIDLLISAIALKFLEHTNERDTVVHGNSLIFMSSIPFIFHVDWYMIFYMLITVIVDYAILMSIFSYSSKRYIFKYSTKLILCSLPLATIIFFVLPRFNPFWQMPAQEASQTGLGDNISFNSIENLIKDNSVAFRVNFDGDIPSERYFTAMYYPEYNSLTQSFDQGFFLKKFENSLTLFSKQTNHQMLPKNFTSGTIYHIYLEPNHRRWIPTLLPSVTFNEQIVYTPLGTWLDRLPITQGRYYKFKYLTSIEDQEWLSRSRISTIPNIFLDTGISTINPQTREFVKKLKKESSDDRDFAQKILQYFAEEEFRYTLNPVKIDKNSNNIIDDFLFKNRNGFCNHYSTATAYMLRLAGIPSMIAGGYLGGSINENDQFVTVRNSDAHSWVMALINKHWVRIDPVAAIAPERIEKSYFETIATTELPIFAPQRYNNIPVISWFREKLEALEFQWTRLILNYNFDNEQGFISSFFAENTLFATICLMLAFIVVVYLTLLLKKTLSKSSTESPLQKAFCFYLDKLKTVNFVRKKNETIRIFFERIGRVVKNKQLTEIFSTIVSITEKALYEHSINEKEAISKLKKLRKQFINELKKEITIRNSQKLHF